MIHRPAVSSPGNGRPADDGVEVFRPLARPEVDAESVAIDATAAVQIRVLECLFGSG